MKANAVIRIIVFALLIVILLGVLIVGVLVGFYGFNNDFHTEIDGINSSSGEADPSAIRDIHIQWAAGDITIVPADTDIITFAESGSFDEDEAMVWKVSGDELVIQYSKGKSSIFSFGITINANISKNLVITVPMDWSCDKLIIDCAAADLNVNDFTAKTIEFNGASGDGNFTNCLVESLSVDTASGDFDYSGELTYLECNAASAKCKLVLTNHPKSMEIDCMSGDLDITLPEYCGFTAEMDSMSGKISTEFATTSSNGKMIYGDGSCRIEADSMSANITIRKGA